MATLCEDKLNAWLAVKDLPEELRNELEGIKDCAEAIEDRFYKDLAFGTGGLRGVMGAGCNRMNVYTVARATQGLANYLSTASDRTKRVAIAYDSRINSQLFAQTAASVFAANEITAWIYPQLEPTPALSWAVRYLQCDAGICITASHNPLTYNGYKVYSAQGCQITGVVATAIQQEIDRIDVLTGAKQLRFSDGEVCGKIKSIPEDVLNAYIDAVYAQKLLHRALPPVHVVYTPLNGTGRACVLEIMRKQGIEQVTVVPEQEWPDGRFPTCPSPNPEEADALQKGLALCKSSQADLLLATDPDCDRIGVAVAHHGQQQVMNGNEIGVLLLDYICKMRIAEKTMPAAPVAVTTLVSTDMADPICAKYRVELRRTLTGFKFIGEQIGLLEKSDEAARYIFGFEESCGYLSGTHVRDKDAVNAALLISEMTQYYKEQGKTLVDALNALFTEFGYYKNYLHTFAYEGPSGMSQMREIMERLRKNSLAEIGGFACEESRDYLSPGTGLPPTDMLAFVLSGGSKLLVRPSGTEPKIKFYVSAKGESLRQCAEIDRCIKKDIEKMVKQ